MKLVDSTLSGAFIVGFNDCGEAVSAAGGRISTQSGTAMDILQKSQDKDKNTNLINKVTASGHNSVVEHTYFNIAFQNVSVIVEQFVIEFRLASFTVKSRRYVDFSEAGFYVPDFKTENKRADYITHMNDMFSSYEKLLELGIPREDARFLLPYCLFSNFICSVNGREFLNLIRAMIYGRGKNIPEIYNLGKQLYDQANELAPGLMMNFHERAKDIQDEMNLTFVKFPKNATSESKKDVELLAYTENASKVVAKNALIFATGKSSNEIDKALCNEEVIKNVIGEVLKSSRPRPLESVSFTLRYNKVSLSTITHFARHRMQGIEIPSLFTTDRTSFIIPPSVENNEEAKTIYLNAFNRNINEYNRLKKVGLRKEILVYYQLSGNTLDIVSTMNARELLLFMKLRSCTRAQWEIRNFAIEALRLLREVSPEIFNSYGPSCYIKSCPEGRFSCGRAAEMKEFFKDIN